ncbi:MAG: carbohydrate ABC transporter permease [Desulfovibrio sp.]|uniref:carbohydrate ABC transporter permease n=1 Tax=Desulfovibrio sp. 7SRBS1 TaxID=3378064 RepID=UPI003B4200BF
MMKGWRQHSETTALLAPALVIMAIVTFIPLFRTIVFSFTNAEITALDTPVKWIGLENYIYALTDPDFRDALWRTFYFTFVSVGLETLLGLGVAMFLNLEFKGRTILRTLIILPWAVPNIVNAMMWRLIFHPDYGSFNAFLYQLGFIHHYKSWLGDPDSAMNMVIMADVWKNYPLIAFVILAALQTIPRELYDAARVEAAGAWHRFRYITLPGIAGPLLVVIILRTIEAFRVFDIVYVMTRGGPADTTKTASFYVYQEYFSYLRSGSGASYAVIIAVISALMIGLYFGVVKKQEAVR